MGMGLCNIQNISMHRAEIRWEKYNLTSTTEKILDLHLQALLPGVRKKNIFQKRLERERREKKEGERRELRV